MEHHMRFICHKGVKLKYIYFYEGFLTTTSNGIAMHDRVSSISSPKINRRGWIYQVPAIK